VSGALVIDVEGFSVLSTSEIIAAPTGAQQTQHRFLWVTHALGGGVERHVADLRALLRAGPRRRAAPGRPRVVRLERAEGEALVLSAASWPRLAAWLGQQGYSRLHPPDRRLRRRRAGPAGPARLPYDVTLHDYFPYCPRYNLSTPEGGYCGEPDPGRLPALPAGHAPCLGPAGAHLAR
jgi:hypothetical protein